MSVKPPGDSVTDMIVGDKPELRALTSVERKSWATRLRTQAQDAIDLANRIHPEGSDLFHLVNGENMSTIATRWEKVKSELNSKTDEINVLKAANATLEAQNAELSKSATDLKLLSQNQAAELRNIRTEQIIIQQRINDLGASSNKLLAQYEADKATWESERNEINTKLSEALERLGRVRDIIGGIPDDADKAALDEMDNIGAQPIQSQANDDELYLPDSDTNLPPTNFVFHVKK